MNPHTLLAYVTMTAIAAELAWQTVRSFRNTKSNHEH